MTNDRSKKTNLQKGNDAASLTAFPSDSRRSSRQTSYTGVDVFKFFFAICIVALHTHALDFLPHMANYMITKVVFRAAVPYFFVASGFFLGNKLLNAPKGQYAQIICGYCRRLAKPLIFFEIISLLYNGLVHLHSGEGIVTTLYLLGQSILFYPYGALWYVQACIVGALLLYPFLKRDKLNLALAIGIPLYGFALIANNYSFLIINTPLQNIVVSYLKYCVSARNGLFTGFLFLALGILCSKIQQGISNPKAPHKWLATVLCLVYVAEIWFIYSVNKAPLDDGALYISHLFLIPVLFITTLQLDFPISPKTAVLFRSLSTGIYFLHRPILYVSHHILPTGWMNFLFVLGSGILICLFTYKTRLKFLYPLLK